MNRMNRTARAQIAHMQARTLRLKKRYQPRIVPGIEALQREYEKHVKRLSSDLIERLKHFTY